MILAVDGNFLYPWRKRNDINYISAAKPSRMKTLYPLLLLFCCLNSMSTSAQLTGMNPDSAIVGTTLLNTTITSNSAFVQVLSPNGNVYDIYLREPGGYSFVVFDGINQPWIGGSVVDPSTFLVDNFSIPINAPLGAYTLYVGFGDPWTWYPGMPLNYDSLPGAFTILPPDGYISANVFNDDNWNEVWDPGEPGLSGHRIDLTPASTAPISTGTSGNIMIPAINGAYTVEWKNNTADLRKLTGDSSLYHVTVNNNTPVVNFPVHHRMYTILPNQFVALQQVRVTILADTFLVPGITNISRIRFSGALMSFIVNSANITIIDSSTIEALVSVPSTAYGPYSVRVEVSGAGYYYLPDSVQVFSPQTTMSGHIYYDTNGNGVRDSSETPLSNQRVRLMPDNAYAFTNLIGDFNIGSLYGNHTLLWDPPAGSPFILSSDSASYTFNSSGAITGLDFGLVTTNSAFTGRLLISDVRPRCLTSNTYGINAINESNTVYKGRIWFIKSPLTTYVSSSIPLSGMSGDSLWWDVPGMQPFHYNIISVTLTMPGAGNVLYQTAIFEGFDANNVLQNTITQQKFQTVLCSFDPNDKACTPEGVGTERFTLIGDWLEYRIRFQNTGNDTAFHVNIYDQLDEDLDWSTFEVLESSHSLQTFMDSTGQVRFYFPNILLPDSNVNEPGSNGFVRYRIRHDINIPEYTVIENTAYIVFDLNPAIVTNTTMNTMVTQIPVWISRPETDQSALQVYPNPFRDYAIFKFENADRNISRFELIDITGRVIQREVIIGNELLISKNALTPGVYIYHFYGIKGDQLYSGKVVVE